MALSTAREAPAGGKKRIQIWASRVVGGIAGFLLYFVLVHYVAVSPSPRDSHRERPTEHQPLINIADLKTEPERSMLNLVELDGWMLSDPVACLNYLSDSSMLFLVGEDDAAAAVLRAANGDPILAIQLAKNLRSGRLQQRINTDAYGQLIDKNPENALKIHSTLPPNLQLPLGRRLARSWGKADGLTAVKGILGAPKNTLRSGDVMLGDALSEWAAVDVNSALQFWRDTRLSEFARKSVSKNGQLDNIIKKLQPDKAIAVLQSLPPSAFRDLKIEQCLAEVIARNPAKVEEAVQSLSNTSNAAVVINSAAILALDRDPETARVLLEDIPGERMRGESAGHIAAKLLHQTNARVATEWAAKIRDPITRNAAYARLKQFGVTTP